MKKIVHITNDLQRLGGVQRLLVDLVTLQKDVFEFEIILTRGKNEYQDELKHLGIPVYHKKDIGLWGAIKRLNKADLVHAHLFPSIYIALFAKCPVIITEHNPHYRRRDLPFVKTLESILFRRYKKILCISEGVQKSFLDVIKVNRSVTQVVYNGVNLSRFPLKAKCYLSGKSKFKIGMVGRLVPQKDIKTLLRLMTNLDDNFELHIAGDGELRNEFEKFAIDISVQDKVYFHGQVNDIESFLDMLDLYVQSSFEEGFGLAVVEAMAAGLPCFATNVDGLNNIIDKKYLFEVGNSYQLFEKIIDISQSSEIYNSHADYSIDQALKYSISKTALSHSEIYQDVIKKYSRGNLEY